MRAKERTECHAIDSEHPDLKERQSSKIKELAHALVAEGFLSLDDQAGALGLSRSTTWTILQARHKNYGLSAAVINRVLGKPDLNSRVRAKIVEYIREKAAGAYGHNDTQLDRFARQLTRPGATVPHDNVLTQLRVRERNRLAPRSERKQSVKIASLGQQKINHHDQ